MDVDDVLEQVLEQLLLRAGQRDDRERARALVRIGQACTDVGNDRLGLGTVRTNGIRCTLDAPPADAEVSRAVRGRQHLDAVAVVAAVREREQVLVAAPVVRDERQLRHAHGERDVEQALTLGGHRLASVANDDRGATAGERAERVRDGKPRRLVEHDDVEPWQRRIQMLGDRVRRRQHARREARQDARQLGEHRA